MPHGDHLVKILANNPENIKIKQCYFFNLISNVINEVGHPPLYVTFSVRPSVCLSVAHHISGTIHHLIIIFGTHM